MPSIATRINQEYFAKGNNSNSNREKRCEYNANRHNPETFNVAFATHEWQPLWPSFGQSFVFALES
jgi:hypothetical protein